ncbi:release factor H-coupled RctB family protein, partial [Lecanoromycetidae sp. Uapishka_2]
MPSTLITIASNSNQSVKAPIVLPSLNSGPAYHSHIIKVAKDKLRLKKPSRIFLQGGRELTPNTEWSNALEKNVVLLVSIGEDYVGNKTEDAPSAHPDANPKCPVNLLANTAFVDTESTKQLETTARTLPGIVHAVGQPDLHPGTKFPIGAVFVSRGWIHPPLIGGDIGCGMAWYKTNLSRSHVEGDKGKKIADKLRGLEGPWCDQRTRMIWLETDGATGSDYSAGEEWDKALGTVGAGNHFAELQVVEKSGMKLSNTHDGNEGLFEDEVVLLVHSGSRGYGGDILKRFTKDGRNSIHENDLFAKEYLDAHDRACAWASRNRDLIALRFLSCLEPGEWTFQSGSSEASLETYEQEIRSVREAVQRRKVVDIYHNNVEATIWNPHNDAEPPAQKAYIHRKGAAPTHNPQTATALSILPLPGSRATPTLILRPIFGNPNSNGTTNAFSLAHGAGRAMSRAKAAEYVAGKYSGRSDDLLRGDFVRSDKKGNKQAPAECRDGRDVKGGCWVVCEDKELVWEEAPEAYKNVFDVADDLVAKGCAEIVGWCRPLVSYKIRRE